MESYLLILISLVTSLLQGINSDDDCLYTFESESEMEDFDPTCDGTKGKWKIMEIPGNAPPSFGKKALTIEEQSQGCIKSSKQLTLNSTTKVLIKFYWTKQQWGNVDFKIKFLTNNVFHPNNINSERDFNKESCTNNKGCEWDIGKKYNTVVGEKWVEDEFHVFTLPEIQDYEMQIVLYLNSAKVMIDSITIVDIISNSDQCYLNPRTTTTTTELTTMTTTEITNTAEISTTTEITTAGKSTTIDSTITTEETTSITETITTEGSETTAADATTTTSQSTTEEQTTGTTDFYSTLSNEITITSSTLVTVTSNSNDNQSSTGSTAPSTHSNSSHDLIFVIVFALLISIVIFILFSSFIIWFRRRRKFLKSNCNSLSPMPISGRKPKTDHEYYTEVREKWKIASKKHNG